MREIVIRVPEKSCSGCILLINNTCIGFGKKKSGGKPFKECIEAGLECKSKISGFDKMGVKISSAGHSNTDFLV